MHFELVALFAHHAMSAWYGTPGGLPHCHLLRELCYNLPGMHPGQAPFPPLLVSLALFLLSLFNHDLRRYGLNLLDGSITYNPSPASQRQQSTQKIPPENITALCGAHHSGYQGLSISCAIGFSGVIFGLIVIEMAQSGASSISIFGFVSIPPLVYPWVLLLLCQILMPNVSFWGHLSGILVSHCVDAAHSLR